MDRPPPTSYRDEQGVFHPGPGCRGYLEHAAGCRPCRLYLHDSATAGDPWARKLDVLLRVTAGPVEPASTALVTAPRSLPVPRSLPTRWRRYAQPGALIGGVLGATGAWLLPASVTAAAIGVLIVAAVAIHRYIPDAVPAARAIRR